MRQALASCPPTRLAAATRPHLRLAAATRRSLPTRPALRFCQAAVRPPPTRPARPTFRTLLFRPVPTARQAIIVPLRKLASPSPFLREADCKVAMMARDAKHRSNTPLALLLARMEVSFTCPNTAAMAGESAQSASLVRRCRLWRAPALEAALWMVLAPTQFSRIWGLMVVLWRIP